MNRQLGLGLMLILLGLQLSGCASQSPRPELRDADAEARAVAGGGHPGEAAIGHARAVLGTPYRYGGASAASGFDCSGLVQYAYAQAGVAVPRTTRAQLSRLNPLPTEELEPGDLLFFRIDKKAWHVGLYAGEGRFIHAPSSGKRVSEASLDNPYWRRHLYRSGRVY